MKMWIILDSFTQVVIAILWLYIVQFYFLVSVLSEHPKIRYIVKSEIEFVRNDGASYKPIQSSNNYSSYNLAYNCYFLLTRVAYITVFQIYLCTSTCSKRCSPGLQAMLRNPDLENNALCPIQACKGFQYSIPYDIPFHLVNSMNLKVCNASNYQSNSHTDRHIQQMTIYACAMNVVMQSLESFSQVGCHCCCIMIIPICMYWYWEMVSGLVVTSIASLTHL